MRRSAGKVVLLLCCLMASIAFAQSKPAAVTLRLNDNYREIKQQPVADASRIEVIDFFFYACPYCNQMRPTLEKWRKTLGEDIVFRRVPTVRRDTWQPLARTYYTLEALGEVERLHEEVYKSYHDEQLHMSTPEVMADWAARHGIDRQKWLDTYNSEDITLKVEQARKMTDAYDIQGTPSIVVNGRYLTSSGMTDDVALVIPVVQALIDRARAQR
jgi:thiol:disulfide interchange protein DsbA